MRGIPIAQAGSALALVLACLAWPSHASADPVRLLIIGGSAAIVSQADAAFAGKHGDGVLEVLTAGEDVAAQQLEGVHVVFAYYPRNEALRGLVPMLTEARRRGTIVVGAPRSTFERYVSVEIDPQVSAQAEAYWDNGGVANLTAFLELMYRAGGGTRPIAPAPPAVEMVNGLYHPRAGRGTEGPRRFESLRDYLAWYRAAGLAPAGAPLVGLMFSHTNIRFRDLAHIDALIGALEHAGVGAVPIYGWPLRDVEPYLTVDGTSPLRVLLSLNLTVIRPGDEGVFERVGVRVMNLMVTRETETEWAANAKGLTPDRVPPYLNLPERLGATEPMLVAAAGSRTEATMMRPVAERLDAVVRRVKRWIALQDLPNAYKHVAMLYYNNPPGRGNAGASYLRVFPTLVRLLERMRAAGYATGDRVPDERELVELLEKSGRNIELWAPGELDALVRDGHATLVPMATYRRWFAELPQAFRDGVLREWGPPEQSRLMTYAAPGGQTFFVVPGVRFGNVFIGPQPLRTTFERAMDTAHDPVTPVPHAYVAAYLWYRHTFGADAIVHVGRHGTLEWLPGKQVAQSDADTSEVLLGDLPNPYLYIMDGGGEAIQAKRRGAAVLLSHLTPLIVAGGARAEFDSLHQALDQLTLLGDASPELAREYQAQAIEDLRRLKLDRQLGLDLDAMSVTEIEAAAHAFAHSVTNGPIPAGIHAVGELPPDRVQFDALVEVIKSAFLKEEWGTFESEASAWVDALMQGEAARIRGEYAPQFKAFEDMLAGARVWFAALRESPARGIDALMHVLGGRYLPTGLLGDPLKVPAALPAGRNLHAFDGALIPTPAAWTLGRKMADQTLARFLEDTGKYPEKISVSLWYGETERNQGAMEAMALHLLGVQPVWNPRGVVEELRLIPDNQMSHPRVDVVFTITGIYRDGFSDKVLLLDRAVRLAASAGDNAVSRHNRAVSEALTVRGLSRSQADRMGRARVFGNGPGHYGLGVERMVDQGSNAGRDEDVAALFLHSMNHAFSADAWGEDAAGALASHLVGNEAVVFSRSSNLYGVLDNEDTYAYVGGLSLATRVIAGRAPQYYLHNLRKAGAESLVDAQTWLAYELNGRLWNPYWLHEMIRSGYAGAREISRELDHLYGFQATTPEQMDGTFWQESFDVLVADRHGLRLDEFFASENPHAQQRLLARLLDVDRQGAYRFPDADRRTLVEKYVQSVRRDGFSCTALTCGSRTLTAFVDEQAARVPGLGALELQEFRGAIARATQPQPRLTTTRSPGGSSPPAPDPVASPVPTVKGYVMQELADMSTRGPAPLRVSLVYALAIIGLLCAGAVREAFRRNSHG